MVLKGVGVISSFEFCIVVIVSFRFWVVIREVVGGGINC